jgi:hypothetical protein
MVHQPPAGSGKSPRAIIERVTVTVKETGKEIEVIKTVIVTVNEIARKRSVIKTENRIENAIETRIETGTEARITTGKVEALDITDTMSTTAMAMVVIPPEIMGVVTEREIGTLRKTGNEMGTVPRSMDIIEM